MIEYRQLTLLQFCKYYHRANDHEALDLNTNKYELKHMYGFWNYFFDSCMAEQADLCNELEDESAGHSLWREMLGASGRFFANVDTQKAARIHRISGYEITPNQVQALSDIALACLVQEKLAMLRGKKW
jgi:hypothetical protein